jgi:hypothetical protein
MNTLKLTDQEVSMILSSLAFTASVDICIDTTPKKDLARAMLGVKIHEQTGILADTEARITKVGEPENPALDLIIEKFLKEPNE